LQDYLLSLINRMGNCTKIVASDETEIDRALSNR
jgi:hypothetical protein